MTNPDNSVGTNGAFGGRTSVNAFNDGIAAYTSGILSGWACNPSSGLTVVLGGDGNTRDVAIAEDNSGNKTTINNISGTPIAVTVGNAPNNNSRIDSIVAYVDNPPTGSSTATDNYEACGLIVVPGSVASTPVAPTESAIRSAITADGASGTTAYYVVLANVTIPSGTTDLTSDNIAAGASAGIGSNNIDFTTSEVQLTFRAGGSSGAITGTSNATLIKLSNGIGILTYRGNTGWNDAGTGYRNLYVTFNAGFSTILGSSVNSCYNGNVEAYQTYNWSFLQYVDNYVYKSSTESQMRTIQFVIIGTID